MKLTRHPMALERNRVSPHSVEPYITLTSDFGWQSQGVGIMKVVLHARAPQVPVIDVTHSVVPFSLIDGAAIMETLVELPPSGVHLCVVDPGVGTGRRIVAIQTARGEMVVGPDNGVLLPLVQAVGGAVCCHIVENQDLFWGTGSATFHGRDVMAPAAAALAVGTPISELGASVSLADLEPPAYENAEPEDLRVEAVVIHVNRFGTAYLNVGNQVIEREPIASASTVRITDSSGGRPLTVTVAGTFGDVPAGAALLHAGHHGRVQVAVNLGSFVEAWPCRAGDEIILEFAS